MRKAMWSLLVLTALLTSGCVTTGGASQSAVLRAKARVAPALVHIRPVKEVFSRGRREEVQIVGSGFIISADGYVVTNEHVAGQSKFVRCVLYNREVVDAEVVGTDPYTDLAVLKLTTDADDLPFCRLGRSDNLEAGQTVLAMGSPHGLARSVSLGIVSVTDRYLEDRGDQMVSPFNTWIQTDAAINPGNSGGPLVNLKGEVIGVNARMLSGAQNVGFAIPIDIAKEVIDEIIAEGRVTRSWIGETLQSMRAKTDDPTQKGVVVADVDPLSSGYEAGLRAGDVMLSVNGIPTNARFEEGLPAVRKLIADIPVGAEIPVRVLRGNEEIELKVTTAERSALKGSQAELPQWGFTAVNLTPAVARRAQLSSTNGILVTGSQMGGIAYNAGLKKGDIILRVDDIEIENLAHFDRVYGALVRSKKPRVLLDVKHGALTRFVLVKQNGNLEENAAQSASSDEGDGHAE
ncbi:MAG: PDZ domain-containing protein [Nitrospiraceae bacterium]|nr:PDZ domain-containing protein [Nitrospiraceae bacterium]